MSEEFTPLTAAEFEKLTEADKRRITAGVHKAIMRKNEPVLRAQLDELFRQNPRLGLADCVAMIIKVDDPFMPPAVAADLRSKQIEYGCYVFERASIVTQLAARPSDPANPASPPLYAEVIEQLQRRPDPDELTLVVFAYRLISYETIRLGEEPPPPTV